MNVYVESGFVLKLALQQDDYQIAERVLQLAEQGSITLKIPAFSLSEPLATVRTRGNSRNLLLESLDREIRELGRTEPHRVMSRALDQYRIQMTQVLQTQLDAVEQVMLRLSRVCEILQLDTATLMRASSIRHEFSFRQLQDAIILATIVLDLERSPTISDALFISQDSDFQLPLVEELLQRLGCKYLADFTNAVRFIEQPGASD